MRLDSSGHAGLLMIVLGLAFLAVSSFLIFLAESRDAKDPYVRTVLHVWRYHRWIGLSVAALGVVVEVVSAIT